MYELFLIFEIWALIMLTIIITNKSIRDTAKEVIVKTREYIPGVTTDTGVEIVTDKMEIDIERGVEDEYYRSRY